MYYTNIYSATFENKSNADMKLYIPLWIKVINILDLYTKTVFIVYVCGV